MRYIIICCLLALAAAAKDNKKISLEDIERDNLKTDKRTRTIPSKAPTDYGFVPVKTATEYVRQQPKQQYLPQHHQYLQAQPQQQQHYIQEPKPQYLPAQPEQQYQPVQPQQYQAAQPQQYVQQHFSSPPRQSTYVTAPQTYQPQPQQYATVPQQYYIPSQNYPQYENVQYVTDNSISAQASQQYYTPQYYYVQQYSSPSSPIQAVIDPKGNIEYVMYVPAQYVQRTEQTQNYESVNYPDSQEYVAPQYTPQPQPKTQTVPHITYAEPQVGKTRYFTQKHEPKSLLDSYVPSYLQIQYLKQQQQAAQENSLKGSPKIGKIEFSKNAVAESNVNYNYQVPLAHRH